MKKPRLLESVVAVATAISVWTYYTYQTSVSGVIRPRQLVHVTLSRTGAASLATTIGPNVRSLDGRILDVTPYEIRLSVTQIERVVGPGQFVGGEPLTIPRTSADAITVRSPDPLRTALAMVGIVGGMAAGNAASGSELFSMRRRATAAK